MVSRRRKSGFTLIELLVVLAIVSLLLTIALPRYFASMDRARERVLVENLRVTRDAIGKFYSDRLRYPDSLDELVDQRYLQKLPYDPVLDKDQGWILVQPSPPARGGVADLHSAAPGAGIDGRAFSDL
ncbi:type II secretion system protein [Niveibacterium terrae]|uniref:type II secretion system protein n=1 Tax=Niveibacterium terrae TaxID=3373598 RepID=UPI003A91A323